MLPCRFVGRMNGTLEPVVQGKTVVVELVAPRTLAMNAFLASSCDDRFDRSVNVVYLTMLPIFYIVYEIAHYQCKFIDNGSLRFGFFDTKYFRVII